MARRVSKSLLADIKQLRRDHVAAALDSVGKTELGRRTGISPDYLYQMGKGTGSNARSVNDLSAKQIEEAMGWPEGYMDYPVGDYPSGGSQPMRLDPTILAESIAALRQVAAGRGWDYDPQEHAASTCYAYAMWLEMPETPSTANVIDFAEKVAARLQREMEKEDGQ